MKPYQHINYILQTIMHDCMNVDVEHYVFNNDARWNTGNTIPSKYMYSSNEYYDFNNKKWRSIDDRDRIYPTIVDHSFEPVNYALDFDLWDLKFREHQHWPMYKDSKFIEIQDLPLIVLHSEKNSNDIDKLTSLGYTDVHWFSHAFLCSEYYFSLYNKLDIVKNYQARPIQYAWVCANRLLRKHRTDFLEMLDLDQGCYSLASPDPNGLIYNGPVAPHSFDDHGNSSAEINVTTLDTFNTSFLHVVSETVWQDKIHFTEKVFKPIVLHQPFVVLQAPGSLEYLRSYGFKTFGDWWDESYDTIEDPDQRMQAIADIVNWIGSKSLDELETMRTEMASDLEYNFRHFYENIPAICIDELRANLTP